MNYKRRKKRKKFEKNKINKEIRRLRRKNRRKRFKTQKENNDTFVTDVIDIMYKKRIVAKEKRIRKQKRQEIIELPKIFSFSKKPEEVMEVLAQIVTIALNSSADEIYFDYSNCMELGISASTIMDIILLGVKSYAKKRNQMVKISGYCPEESSIKNILLASGIVKHLKLSTYLTLDSNERHLFELQGGRNGSKKSDLVATRLKDYFQKCLFTQGYTLTDEGENYLCVMFGEVINNCEIHAGDKSIWYTLGHYEVMDKESYGEFQLVIVSFGDSIYEQFLGNETTEQIQELLTKMDQVHKNKYNEDWNQEALYTVLALQEGISRLKDKNSEGNCKRGTGTIRLLETFYNLGMTNKERNPLLSVYSGHIIIKFDGRYKLQEECFSDEIFGHNTRRIIAFNEENDIFSPANSDVVTVLKKKFPGTVISIKFYLDSEYLKDCVKE